MPEEQNEMNHAAADDCVTPACLFWNSQHKTVSEEYIYSRILVQTCGDGAAMCVGQYLIIEDFDQKQ